MGRKGRLGRRRSVGNAFLTTSPFYCWLDSKHVGEDVFFCWFFFAECH